MKNNKVIFDLGHSNRIYKWYEARYEWYSIYYPRFQQCEATFLECQNTHLMDCQRRLRIEQCMWTRLR